MVFLVLFVSKEISLKEQLEIRKNCDMPLFVLGHGVQYMMMSKKTFDL